VADGDGVCESRRDRVVGAGAQLVGGLERARRCLTAAATGAGRRWENSTARAEPTTYRERLLEQLDAIKRDYLAVLEASEIQYVNPNRPGDDFVLLTAADWGWAPSGPALESQRMDLLRRLRGWAPRFRLLFPHPTPDTAERLKESLEHLERWLVREGT